MSNHDHHESKMNESEKFVPLSDNNNNLSKWKFVPLILSLALILIALVSAISKVGYLNNEEQVHWKHTNHATSKDSHENKYYKETESSGTEMKAKEGEPCETK